MIIHSVSVMAAMGLLTANCIGLLQPLVTTKVMRILQSGNDSSVDHNSFLLVVRQPYIDPIDPIACFHVGTNTTATPPFTPDAFVVVHEVDDLGA
jgi:hypothetical protein